jgi:predicted lipid-binding transport protein (Tim44 family)
MKTRRTVAAIILFLAALIVSHAAIAADPVKDAKDAYAQFVKAAKAKKMEEVKKLLAKEALSDLEKDNMLDLFADMQADVKPETIEAAKSEVKGSMVVLKIEQVEKTKEGTLSTKMTVYMVKEGGQWKVGKPEGAK